MEYLTSLTRLTFMERSLPDVAFGSGRNIGIRYDSQDNNKRVRFGLGLFLNTGSFSDFGEAQSQINEANGFNTTLRVYGLPWHENNGKKLHLGLGYSHGRRDENKIDARMKLNSRPESRVTDDKLVDTGPIIGSRRDMTGSTENCWKNIWDRYDNNWVLLTNSSWGWGEWSPKMKAKHSA